MNDTDLAAALGRQCEEIAEMDKDLMRASPQFEFWLARLNEILALQPGEPEKAAIEEAMLHVALAVHLNRHGPAMVARQLHIASLAFFEAAERAKASGSPERGTIN